MVMKLSARLAAIIFLFTALPALAQQEVDEAPPDGVTPAMQRLRYNGGRIEDPTVELMTMFPTAPSDGVVSPEPAMAPLTTSLGGGDIP